MIIIFFNPLAMNNNNQTLTILCLSVSAMCHGMECQVNRSTLDTKGGKVNGVIIDIQTTFTYITLESWTWCDLVEQDLADLVVGWCKEDYV